MKTYRVECTRTISESCTVQVRASNKIDAAKLVRKAYQTSDPDYAWHWREDEASAFDTWDVYPVKA